MFITWPVSEFTVGKSGVFGDSFGLLTSFFSGLAFAGLIITMLMQKEELELQRKELSLTREELVAQRQELTNQNNTMRQQRFENTFFQMLSLHNEIVRSVEIGSGSKQLTGRSAFELLRSDFITNGDGKYLKDAGIDRINEIYLKFHQKNQHRIGHYFRNLYTIIKFVDESDVESKKLYTNIVRAQLSSYELFFLFYNCLSEMGKEKFKRLVEEYALLKNLPDSLIENLATHKQFYGYRAYGGREAEAV